MEHSLEHFADQKSSPCLLLGQASSLPLSHQGSPSTALSKAQGTKLLKPPPNIQGINLPVQPACPSCVLHSS